MNPKTSTLATAQERLDKKSIEQLIQHLRYNCRTNVRSGFHFQASTPSGTSILHARCNQLACRYCCGRRLGTLNDALMAGSFHHNLDYLVTLTLRRKPTDQSAELRAALGRFLNQARRTFPAPFIYWWCYGVDQGGRPHVHLLTNHDMKYATRYRKRTEWLKRTWCGLTGAHQANSKPITPGTHQTVITYMLSNLLVGVVKGFGGRLYSGSRPITAKPKRERDPNAPRYRYVKGPSAAIIRREGLDLNPITNPDFFIDAQASSGSMAMQPLGRSAATAPAELHGRAVPALPPVGIP